jgi:hypothetical protein
MFISTSTSLVFNPATSETLYLDLTAGFETAILRCGAEADSSEEEMAG